MRRVALLAVVALTVCASPALAEDFTGIWEMNANGATFTLRLKHATANEVFGNMTRLNGDEPVTSVKGRVSGRKITLSRAGVNQNYVGYMFEGDKTSMAGIFAGPGQPMEYGWYATGKHY